MTRPLHVLLVAKAPVPGEAKTRLATVLGDRGAADVAAAALLDTLSSAEAATRPRQRLIALAGELAEAERGDQIKARLEDWHVVSQDGETFADRLVHAHRAAAGRWGSRAVVVQIGMDTPQLTPSDLALLVTAATRARPDGCALGSSPDGGWWGLATGRAGYAEALAGVPMSRPDTGALTAAALRRTGAVLTPGHAVRDVDTVEDAVAVSRAFPDLLFSRAFVRAFVRAYADRVRP